MKLNAKNMLKSREILRLVVFFAVTVLLGFSTVGNVEALIVFVVSGLLGSFYSKNMIVVLGVAILLTLIWYLFSLGYYREGMKHNKKKPKNHKRNRHHMKAKMKKRKEKENEKEKENNDKNKVGFENKLNQVSGMINRFEGLINKVNDMKNSIS